MTSEPDSWEARRRREYRVNYAFMALVGVIYPTLVFYLTLVNPQWPRWPWQHLSSVTSWLRWRSNLALALYLTLPLVLTALLIVAKKLMGFRMKWLAILVFLVHTWVMSVNAIMLAAGIRAFSDFE